MHHPPAEVFPTTHEIVLTRRLTSSALHYISAPSTPFTGIRTDVLKAALGDIEIR